MLSLVFRSGLTSAILPQGCCAANGCAAGGAAAGPAMVNIRALDAYELTHDTTPSTCRHPDGFADVRPPRPRGGGMATVSRADGARGLQGAQRAGAMGVEPEYRLERADPRPRVVVAGAGRPAHLPDNLRRGRQRRRVASRALARRRGREDRVGRRGLPPGPGSS